MVPHQNSFRAFLPTTLLLTCFAGLFAASVLGVGHVLDLPVPCGGSRGCAAVALHPSAKVFGLPIAWLGVTVYLGLIALLARAQVGPWAQRLFVLLAGAGTVVSAGLLVYSQTVIRATCPWCVASGLAMTVLFLLGWVARRGGLELGGARPAMVWSLALFTATLVGLQAGWMEREASRAPIAADRLARIGPAELVDRRKSAGPESAPVTIVMFGDFWCPACRTALESLLRYRSANPGKVRLIYRHRPLPGIKGHESSEAAAALSEIAAERGRFWEFAAAVHAARQPMDRTQFLELMRQLECDPLAAEARLDNPADPAVGRVLRDIDLAERLGVFSTPTFVVLLGDRPALSASARHLPRMLNSRAVVSLLAGPSSASKAGADAQ